MIKAVKAKQSDN